MRVQLSVDRLLHVAGAHARVALGHYERLPAAHVHDGDKVDPGSLARCLVLRPQRIASRDAAKLRVLVRLAKAVEEYMAITNLARG